MLLAYSTTKTTAEVLRDYGFVAPGNPNDRIALDAADFSNDDGLPMLDAARLVAHLSMRGNLKDVRA